MESRYLLFFSDIYNKKILQSGLWLVWMCGLFLIGVSFYGTLMLPSFLKEQVNFKKPHLFGVGFDDLTSPKITLFTAPRPFVGSTGEKQALAVRSWLELSENINVVLFSQDPSVFLFAESIGSRVSVETKIDFTFLGTPFFHSMVLRSLASSSDVSALIDPDTILLPDFLSTLRYAHKLDEDWLLVASPQNVSTFPFHLDTDWKSWLGDDGKHVGTQKLQEFLAQKESRKPHGARMLIAWNSGDMPLHKGVLPPFLFGKGLHNQWLVTEALISEFRLVIDASLTISSFYLNGINQGNSDFENKSWELIGNSLLGRSYGSFSFREPNYSNLFRFSVCGQSYLLVNTHQNIAYQMGYKRSLNLRNKGNPLSSKQKEMLDCVDEIKSLEGIEGCFENESLRLPASISLPLSLESLLSMQADENKTIVLGIAGYSYKDMLMSWVCRLHHLQLLNFLVCALDDETYDFSVLQGLPVIKCASPPTSISFENCHFGTECFQKVTKVKSRMVLQILKLGYNVLLSDVDVYWFKNPLNLLTSFGPAVLVAQSDEYNLTGPINLPRRLNSGFYYAHSDSITIAALEKVVKHAATSNLSEQPSFYDTLCGEGGSYRLGDNQCLEPETNLLVHFLDRNLFPNGAYQGLWEEKDTKNACLERGCLILHNNWINGRKKKLERQVLSGLWEYDINNRMCLHSWHRNNLTSSFGIMPKKQRQHRKQKYALHKQCLEIAKSSAKANTPSSFLLCTQLYQKILSACNAGGMCSCFRSFSFVDKGSKRREELKEETLSLSVSAQVKDIMVRIVHAGGRIEMYQHAIPASKLIQKYPGMCITRPDVFKSPHESLISADDILLPGQKYFLMRRRAMEKLKQRHSRRGKTKEPTGGNEPMLNSKEVGDCAEISFEESVCSAQDFFISKESWSSFILKQRLKEKRAFVPPIRRPRPCRELDWEPSLTSIQELSP